MIAMTEREKTFKISNMPNMDFQKLVLKKLSDLDDFMNPENHKRWFRNNNPELTSSLIRSQINMIRNAIGGANSRVYRANN